MLKITPSVAPLVSFQNVLLVAWLETPNIGIGTWLLPLHRRLHTDMADAGDDHVRLQALDLVEDGREVGGVRRQPDVVQHLQAARRQALQVFLVQRDRPGGIFAHDHRGLHAQVAGQQRLGGLADDVGDLGGGEIAVEDVFHAIVIVMDTLGNLVAGPARRDHWHFQSSGPGFQRQHDLADVAGDDGRDLVLLRGALEGAHGMTAELWLS